MATNDSGSSRGFMLQSCESMDSLRGLMGQKGLCVFGIWKFASDLRLKFNSKLNF
jgi:hypothetical protein